jgi:hypothetical protein
MSDNLIVVENKNDVAKIIANKILEIHGTTSTILEENSMTKQDVITNDDNKIDIIL